MNALVEPSLNGDSFSQQSDSQESQCNIVEIEPSRGGPQSHVYSNLQSNIQTQTTRKSHLSRNNMDTVNLSQDGLQNSMIIDDSCVMNSVNNSRMQTHMENRKMRVRDKQGKENEREQKNLVEPLKGLDDSKMFDLPLQINQNKEYANRSMHRWLQSSVVVFTILTGQLGWIQLQQDADNISFTSINSQQSSKSEQVLKGVLLIVLTFFFLLICVSFYKAYSVDAGCVPRNNFFVYYNQQIKKNTDSENEKQKIITQKIYKSKNQFRDYRHLRPKYLIERFLTQKERQCQFCTSLKPDRTHHCSICKRCVLKFDHHCPWVANCIGYHNQKFFICLLFYASMAMNLVWMTEWTTIVYWLQEGARVKFKDTGLVVYTIAAVLHWAQICGLGLVLTGFFLQHVQLMANNLTTIEQLEKNAKKQQNESPQSRGVLNNLCYTLPQLLFWPVSNNQKEQGVAFRMCDHQMKKMNDEVREYNKAIGMPENSTEDWANMSLVSIDEQFERIQNLDHLNFNE